jgi:hypothetical protein
MPKRGIRVLSFVPRHELEKRKPTRPSIEPLRQTHRLELTVCTKQRSNVFLGRFERDVLDEHLGRARLGTRLVFGFVFLGPAPSKPDVQRVAVECEPLHAFERLLGTVDRLEPNEPVPVLSLGASTPGTAGRFGSGLV